MAKDSDVRLAVSRSVDIDTSQEMHRMLAVYEIICNILQNCQRHDQAVAARVSRLWCDVALDCLWRNIDSVVPLLRLLSPLVIGESGLAFTEKIEPQNWERFRYYGRRVRCLRYDDSDPDEVEDVASSGFAVDLSVTLLALKPAGFGALLPNIRELHWTASHDVLNLQHALPFLHSSVKTLNIALNHQEDDDLAIAARFLCTISGIQGLCLETFAFDTNRASLQLLQNLASLIQEQQAIRVLDMPMEIGHDGVLHNTVRDLIYHALPKELKEFTTDLVFCGFDDYLTRAGTIVRQAQQLHSLKLYLDGTWGWWPEGFYDLTPFLELSELENLELVTLSGIHLDPDDIAVLGKSFPKMVRFAIKPLPHPFDVGIKATALIDFATAFPNLEVLGIRIEPIRGPLVLPWRRSTDHHSHSQAQAYPSFNTSRFRLLDVGPSFLSDHDVPDMAELLSVLCRHPLLEIKYERLEEPENWDPEETLEEDATKAWQKVEALVKLVRGTERDTTKPYHEWCQALISENMDIDIDEDEESMIAEAEVA